MRPLALILLIGACSVDHTGLGADSDAGMCTSPGDCGDDPCRTYACNDGVCASTGCAVGLVCDGTACVPRTTCDPVLCESEGANPSQCRIGECDGDLCAAVSTCEDAEFCCGGGCLECPVDESDPCMEPACEGASCGKVPRPEGTPCNVNGNFCEGFGLCNDRGQCTEDIQMCGEECDPVAEECVGCNVDEDCPDRTTGNNCAAALGALDCTTTVTPTIIPFTCVENVCERGAERDGEPISCNRPNGSECAPTTFSVFSLCEFGNSCLIDGTRTQDRTDWACGRGRDDPFREAVCRSTVTTLEETCSRPSTTGTDCSDDAEAADTEYGTCMGFTSTCDSSGTQTISTYFPTCNNSEACDPAGSTIAPFMGECERETDTLPCGMGTTFGEWSECVQNSASSCRGTRTRTVTDHECQSDSCQPIETTETDNDCEVPDMTSCGSAGECLADSGSANVCIGEERTPICVAGTCDTDNTVPCDRVGFVCQAPEDGTCSASGGVGECGGTRIPITYACGIGGSCDPATGTPTSCPLVGATCGSAASCDEGTCNAASACVPTVVVDCDAVGACDDCLGAEDTCACDGAGGCTCM